MSLKPGDDKDKKKIVHSIFHFMGGTRFRRPRADDPIRQRPVYIKAALLPPIHNLVKVDPPKEIKRACTIINAFDAMGGEIGKSVKPASLLPKVVDYFKNDGEWTVLVTHKTVLDKMKFFSYDCAYYKSKNENNKPKYPIIVEGKVDLSKLNEFYQEERYPSSAQRSSDSIRYTLPPKSAALADTINNNGRFFLYVRTADGVFEPNNLSYFNKSGGKITIQPLSTESDLATLVEQNSTDPSVTQQMFDEVFVPWTWNQGLSYNRAKPGK